MHSHKRLAAHPPITIIGDHDISLTTTPPATGLLLRLCLRTVPSLLWCLDPADSVFPSSRRSYVVLCAKYAAPVQGNASATEVTTLATGNLPSPPPYSGSLVFLAWQNQRSLAPIAAAPVVLRAKR